MSKAKQDLIGNVSVKDEMQQLETSAELAGDFIHDVLLPQLDKFENSNDDVDYMPGMATHGLFVELIQRMGEMGYTEKDLRKELKAYINCSYGQTLH